MPRTAIREDASMNLAVVDELCERFPELDFVLMESGGDTLSATFQSRIGRSDDLCHRRVGGRQDSA